MKPRTRTRTRPVTPGIKGPASTLHMHGVKQEEWTEPEVMTSPTRAGSILYAETGVHGSETDDCEINKNK